MADTKHPKTQNSAAQADSVDPGGDSGGTTWWEVRRGLPIRVQVVKETPQYITIRRPKMWGDGTSDSRRAKRGEYFNYFPTYAEAVKFMIERAEQKVKAARTKLSDAEQHLRNVRKKLEFICGGCGGDPVTPLGGRCPICDGSGYVKETI
jgi:hypothetical protein